MFVKRVSLVAAAAWLLCAGLSLAQMVERLEKKGEGNKSVVVKIDPKELPSDARLRLGKMSGFRYTGSFAFAIMSYDGKLLTVNGRCHELTDEFCVRAVITHARANVRHDTCDAINRRRFAFFEVFENQFLQHRLREPDSFRRDFL